MLTRETIPCRYELSWKGRDGVPGILLRINPDVINKKGGLPIGDAPLVTAFMNDFDFEKFSGRFNGDFGFEESLKRIGVAADGFLEYEIPTPLVKEISNELCGMCDGTGHDNVLDEVCGFCEDGKSFCYNFSAALAASASLDVFLQFLCIQDEETSSTSPQLMFVSMGTLAYGRCGLLDGDYSCEIGDYLRSRPAGDIPEMIAAMRTVWGRMEGSVESFYARKFDAYTQGDNGWLNVICPGDGTGLHPSDIGPLRNGGYRFSSYNVDSPTQQLVLLAALAALHDLARDATAR
jgi:hypothetical protein